MDLEKKNYLLKFIIILFIYIPHSCSPQCCQIFTSKYPDESQLILSWTLQKVMYFSGISYLWNLVHSIYWILWPINNEIGLHWSSFNLKCSSSIKAGSKWCMKIIKLNHFWEIFSRFCSLSVGPVLDLSYCHLSGNNTGIFQRTLLAKKANNYHD